MCYSRRKINQNSLYMCNYSLLAVYHNCSVDIDTRDGHDLLHKPFCVGMTPHVVYLLLIFAESASTVDVVRGQQHYMCKELLEFNNTGREGCGYLGRTGKLQFIFHRCDFRCHTYSLAYTYILFAYKLVGKQSFIMSRASHPQNVN